MHVAIFSQAMEYVSLEPCVDEAMEYTWAPPWCAKGKRLERDSRHGLKRLVKRLKVKAHPYIRWHMRPFHGSLDYSYCSMMVFEEFCVLAIEELETNRSAAARPVARPFAAEARASHEAAPMSLDPLLPLVQSLEELETNRFAAARPVKIIDDDEGFADRGGTSKGLQIEAGFRGGTPKGLHV